MSFGEYDIASVSHLQIRCESAPIPRYSALELPLSSFILGRQGIRTFEQQRTHSPAHFPTRSPTIGKAFYIGEMTGYVHRIERSALSTMPTGFFSISA